VREDDVEGDWDLVPIQRSSPRRRDKSIDQTLVAVAVASRK
jgi:hypothetical protein